MFEERGTELMRIAWRTVGVTITRVWDDVETLHDRFGGRSRIDIDEIADERGHRYLTVVVDHDSGRLGGCLELVPGRSARTSPVMCTPSDDDRFSAEPSVRAVGRF